MTYQDQLDMMPLWARIIISIPVLGLLIIAIIIGLLYTCMGDR